MANNLSKRLSAQLIDDDVDTYLALKALTDYQPSNPAFSLAATTVAYDKMRGCEETELHAYNAYAAARDATVASQRDFHGQIIGSKGQAKAQYGESSDQVASLGLKKKSEHRSGVRRPAKPASPA